MSIAAQMCVDMLRFVNTYPCRSVFVVIARQEPENVLNRVLECLQSKYHQSVLIVEPLGQDDLFKSANSVFERTHFVGGGKTMPPDSAYSKRPLSPLFVLMNLSYDKMILNNRSSNYLLSRYFVLVKLRSAYHAHPRD